MGVFLIVGKVCLKKRYRNKIKNREQNTVRGNVVETEGLEPATSRM